MSDRPTLTCALRELVWGIRSEVAVVSNLSRRIDDHVRSLNDLRAELSERLLELDRLRDAAHDERLAEFVDTIAVAPLPELDEEFPGQLYGS